MGFVDIVMLVVVAVPVGCGVVAVLLWPVVSDWWIHATLPRPLRRALATVRALAPARRAITSGRERPVVESEAA